MLLKENYPTVETISRKKWYRINVFGWSRQEILKPRPRTPRDFSVFKIFKIWDYILVAFTPMKGRCNAEKTNPKNEPEIVIPRMIVICSRKNQEPTDPKDAEPSDKTPRANRSGGGGANKLRSQEVESQNKRAKDRAKQPTDPRGHRAKQPKDPGRPAEQPRSPGSQLKLHRGREPRAKSREPSARSQEAMRQ